MRGGNGNETPLNGSTYRFDTGVNFDKWISLNDACKKDDFYEDWIDRLEDVSATMRNVLKELIKFTTKVGKVVLRIGKIVLNLISKILLKFPNTVSGILVGFILGLICSSIPFLGGLLGPIVIPLFALLGGIKGFMADMSTKLASPGLESRIRTQIKEYFEGVGFVWQHD
jgi:sorbitol-specific phosphotransferase system component IIBC